MQPLIEIINADNEKIDLGNYHFQNFRYYENINQGFPIIEFTLTDNLYQLLKKKIYGDETLKIVNFTEGNFELINKEFKIKSLGSCGLNNNITRKQDLKLIAIDKNYDKILKLENSIYFDNTEKKKSSDLLLKLLKNVGISETKDFKFKIKDSSPLKECGYNNLYIPYTRDPIKLFKKICRYTTSLDGRGGYTFFINRYGIYFLPIHDLFNDPDHYYKFNKDNYKFPNLRITETNSYYQFKNIKISTFNAFNDFLMGYKKYIFGFNNYEEDVNYIEYKPNGFYRNYNLYNLENEKFNNLRTVDKKNNYIPIQTEFMDGNNTSYFTPLDNLENLKGFGDNLHYSQMFCLNMEIYMIGLTGIQNFRIGDIIEVDFYTSNDDRWIGKNEMNGGWLVKSFDYIYPGNHINLSLTKFGSGVLPESYIHLEG